MSGSAAGSPPVGEHAWVRLMPWWHGAFAVLLAALAVWAVVVLHGDPVRLGPLLGVYAVMGGLYALTVGRECRSSWARPVTFLVGAAGLFVAAVFLFPVSGFLLFVLIPQCFMILEHRAALTATVGLVMVDVGANIAYAGGDTSALVASTVFGVLGVAMALLLGAYISRIIDQSAQRAELIAELDRTRSELADVSRRAGALAEREHLAGEIHDVLAQGFTSVIMLLQSARAAMDRGDTASARRSLDLAEPAARDGLAEARSLITALAPPHLQAASLPDALERVGDDLGSRFGFTASFEVTGEARPLAANTEIVLLRATQEALANVGRHAAARSARVRLGYGQSDVTVAIHDDGCGFDPGRPDGFGLAQLRSRAEAVGGWVEVTSGPGQGTTVVVAVPDTASPLAGAVPAGGPE